MIEGGGVSGGYIVPWGSTVPGRRPLVAGPEVPGEVGAGIGTLAGETVGEVAGVEERVVVLGVSIRA